MRQVLTVGVGASLVGAALPSGRPIAAIGADNASGYWYQVNPGAAWIAPYSAGAVIAISGSEVFTVDAVALPKGPDGSISLATGTGLNVTLYDAQEAPAGNSAGASTGFVSPGTAGLRYLGSLVGTVVAGSVQVDADFAIKPTERKLILIGKVAGTGTDQAYVFGTSTLVQTGTAQWGGAAPYNIVQPAEIEISYSLDPSWHVRLITSASVGTHTLYVFADTADVIAGTNPGTPAFVELSNGLRPLFGQDTAANSVPVVLASNQSAIPATLPVGRATMAASTPVVLASDEPVYVAEPPSSGQASSVPAAGTVATATIPAVAGQSVVVDEANFRLLSRGAADILTVRITSAGATTVQARLQVTATAGSTDEWTFHGFSGALGASAVVEFVLAPAAGNFEAVNASFHYVTATGVPV